MIAVILEPSLGVGYNQTEKLESLFFENNDQI